MDVLNLPEQFGRVETGPIQFGDDWPGVFIRGDNALVYAHILEQLLYVANPDRLRQLSIGAPMAELIRTLRSCDAKAQDSREG